MRILSFAALSLLLGLMPAGVRAALFVVDTTSDALLSSCGAEPEDCSLRGAITRANALPDFDQIHFAIPTSDPGFQAASQHWRLSVGNTALPAISEGLLLDGSTQTGAIANTQSPLDGGLNGVLKIEIVAGSSFGTQQNGIDTFSNNFQAAASTIRGLVISRFASQIQLGGSGGHRVEGCYLGTDITGTLAAVTTISGRGNGIRLQGPGPYQIGGIQAAQRNLISGLFSAVVQQSSSPDGMSIRGNLIGTDASGLVAIGNTTDALSFLQGTLRNVQIGGTDALARNVISASSFSAIALSAQGATPFAGTRIEGNFIGTDVSGLRAMGNGLNPLSPSQRQPSIRIGGIAACDLVIGGPLAGQANLIAHSGTNGVSNDQCRGIVAADNVYLDNRAIAFDNVQGGGFIGATPNDVLDADDGIGNRMQNHPELSQLLAMNGNEIQISYRVDTALSNATYPLEVRFYRAGSGGAGVVRLGQASYPTPNALANITLTGPALPLTAVAIDAAGNQSEFAPVVGDSILRNGFE
jgi:CSLREA domain-containing protein